MLIWGRAFTRPSKEENMQYLTMQGMLFHPEFNAEFQRRLGQRFGNVMPAKAKFAISNSTEMCEFTAVQVNLAVKLMVSLLGIVYGDFENAERWLIELGSIRKVLPPIKKEIVKQTQELYLSWLELIGIELALHRKTDHLHRIPRLWESYRRNGGVSLSATLVRAQAYVLLDKDAKSANNLLEEHTKELRSSRTSQAYWFSRAFCFAYLNDLNKAHGAYQIGMSSTRDVENVAVQCEEFINEVLEADPERFVLFFCLGFLNYKIKADFISARRDLEIFLSKIPANDHAKARRLAEGWLSEITTQEMSR